MVEGRGAMEDRISQLMDGELDDRAAAAMLAALGQDGEARDTWRVYHLIGDSLRGAPLLSAGFAARVQEKVLAEPTVLAPKRLPGGARRWFAIPAAIAAGVVLVVSLALLPHEPTQLAEKQPEKTLPSKPRHIPLPSGTPDYLLAHQGFSPRLSLQGMTAYVRTVSDEATEAEAGK